MSKRKVTPLRTTFLVLFALVICSVAIWPLFSPSISGFDGISRILYTPTLTPTPTSTPTPLPPTATPPPLQVPEMAGTSIQTLCVELEEIYPQITDDFSSSIDEDVLDALSRIGIQVVSPGEICDAALDIEVTIKAVQGKYTVGKCYAAYAGHVKTILSSQQARQDVTISRDFETSLPGVIAESDCHQEVIEVLNDHFEKARTGGNARLSRAVLETLVDFWGLRILIPVLGIDGAFCNVATDMLAEAGSSFVPDLMLALEDKTTRRGAVRALGKIGPDAASAVPLLIPLLEDEDKIVIQYAASSLGEIGPEAIDAVPHLIDLLQSCYSLKSDNQRRNCQMRYSDALEGITGQDLGQDSEAWRNWWGAQ